MRDYKLIVLKIKDKALKKTIQLKNDEEKEIFKLINNDIRTIIDYHNDDYECALNNITTMLAIYFTHTNGNKNVNELLDIVNEIFPEPPDRLFEY